MRAKQIQCGRIRKRVHRNAIACLADELARDRNRLLGAACQKHVVGGNPSTAATQTISDLLA
jgi:hypothetical protein